MTKVMLAIVGIAPSGLTVSLMAVLSYGRLVPMAFLTTATICFAAFYGQYGDQILYDTQPGASKTFGSPLFALTVPVVAVIMVVRWILHTNGSVDA